MKETMMKILLILSFLVMCVATTQTYAAGFNCANSSTAIEKQICDNTMLSDMDSQNNVLFQAYKNTFADGELAVTEQRHWLKTVRNICEDITCLESAYMERNSYLQQQITSASDDMGLTQNEGVVGEIDVEATISEVPTSDIQNADAIAPTEDLSAKLPEVSNSVSPIKQVESDGNLTFGQTISTFLKANAQFFAGFSTGLVLLLGFTAPILFRKVF